MRTEFRRPLVGLILLLGVAVPSLAQSPADLREWLTQAPELVVVLVDGLDPTVADATRPDGTPLMPAWVSHRDASLRLGDCLRGGPDPTHPWADLGLEVRIERVSLPTAAEDIPDAVLLATDPRPWHDGDRHPTVTSARADRLATARLLWERRDLLAGEGARHRADREWLAHAAHAVADRSLAEILARYPDTAIVVTAGSGPGVRTPVHWRIPGVAPGVVATPLTVAQVPAWLASVRDGVALVPTPRRWSVAADGSITATTRSWSLTWRPDGRRRLFDLEWDPDRRIDLAPSQPATVARLTTQAPTWLLGSAAADVTWASAGLWPALAAGDVIPPADAEIWDAGLLHPRVGP